MFWYIIKSILILTAFIVVLYFCVREYYHLFKILYYDYKQEQKENKE